MAARKNAGDITIIILAWLIAVAMIYLVFVKFGMFIK